MYKRLIVVGCWLLASHFNLTAQTAWAEIDSLTYGQYMRSEWDSVLSATQQSLARGVDFYYLRLRAGKAAYEQKKYRLASQHFSKAHQWNKHDEFVQYWYYWSLLLSGRLDEAHTLASGFSESFLTRNLLTPPKRVKTVFAESQWSINHAYKKQIEESIQTEDSYINYRSIPKTQLYTAVGLEHTLGRHVHIMHTLSHLNIERSQQFESEYPRLDRIQGATTRQYTYYLQARFPLKNAWNVSTSYTRLWGQTSNHWVTFQNNPTPIVTEYNDAIQDSYFSVGLSKDFSLLQTRLSTSIGSIREYAQFQINPSIRLYPFANNKLVSKTEWALHWDESENGVKKVFHQSIASNLGPAWLSADVSIGPIRNYSLYDSYAVYNMPEEIRKMMGLSIGTSLFDYKMHISTRYQWAEKTGESFHYTNTTDYSTQSLSFTEAHFLIRLLWNL